METKIGRGKDRIKLILLVTHAYPTNIYIYIFLLSLHDFSPFRCAKLTKFTITDDYTYRCTDYSDNPGSMTRSSFFSWHPVSVVPSTLWCRNSWSNQPWMVACRDRLWTRGSRCLPVSSRALKFTTMNWISSRNRILFFEIDRQSNLWTRIADYRINSNQLVSRPRSRSNSPNSFSNLFPLDTLAERNVIEAETRLDRYPMEWNGSIRVSERLNRAIPNYPRFDSTSGACCTRGERLRVYSAWAATWYY